MKITKENLNFDIISVIGNGISLKNLKQNEIDLINNSDIFRTNWFFKDMKTNINKNIFAYFFGINQDDMYNQFLKSESSSKYIMTPLKSIKNKIDFWEDLRNTDTLCKSHLITKKYRKGLNLPTTGLSMLNYAVHINPKIIYVSGIDLYLKKNKDSYTYYGRKEPLGNPYESEKIPHDIKTDLLFLMNACKYHKNIIVLGNEIIKEMVNICYEEKNVLNNLLRIYYEFK